MCQGKTFQALCLAGRNIFSIEVGLEGEWLRKRQSNESMVERVIVTIEMNSDCSRKRSNNAEFCEANKQKMCSVVLSRQIMQIYSKDPHAHTKHYER